MSTEAPDLDITTQPDPEAPRPHKRTKAELSCYVAEEDRYAPAPAGCVCEDRTGYLRREHDFDRDMKCIWCGKGPAIRPAVSYRRKP